MNCRHCHQPMKRVPWNNAGNSLHCDTSGCDLFHAPQGWIRRGEDDHHLNFLTVEKMDAQPYGGYTRRKKDVAGLSRVDLPNVQE
jgi:hypothetical protein